MQSQESFFYDTDAWFLHSEELSLLQGMTDTGRLGFSIQLKFRQMHTYYPESATEIPSGAVRMVADVVRQNSLIINHRF